jgi:hypothetical protein
VRVHQERAARFVPAQVELRDQRGIDAFEIVAGIEAEVRRVHVDVVHVEEKQAAASARHLRNEFPLAHLAGPKRAIRGDVLHEQRAPQAVLRPRDAGGDMRGGLVREGQRQQLVEMAPVYGRP